MKKNLIAYMVCYTILLLGTSQTLAAKNIDTKKIETYQETLKAIPSHTKPLGKRIALAKNAFFKAFTSQDSQATKAAAFKIFYAYYGSVLDEINKDEDGFLRNLNANTEYKGRNYGNRYGFLIDHIYEEAYGASVNTTYLKNTFKNFLPKEFALYFSYLQFYTTGYLERDIKDHDELRKRIIIAENFLKEFPTSEFAEEFKQDMLYDVGVYIRGVDAYSLNAGGYKLELAAKASFEKFLKQNKESKFYGLVDTWYKKLKQDKFKIDYDYANTLLDTLEANN